MTGVKSTFLSVEDLRMAFGGLVALDDVTFDVNKGEIFAIIGPNGAGKTTLFNILTGVYKTSAGSIHLDGMPIDHFDPASRAALGLQRTFQNLQIFHDMTVRENVMVGAHLRLQSGFIGAMLHLPRIGRENRFAWNLADELLERVGIAAHADRPAGTLAYGQQKRLEIARALAAGPRILLLDEPAAGLDANERMEMAELIRTLPSQDTTVVLVEHDMKIVMGISQRIFCLNFGRPLALGTPDEISRNQDVIAAYLGTGTDKNEEEAGT